MLFNRVTAPNNLILTRKFSRYIPSVGSIVVWTISTTLRGYAIVFKLAYLITVRKLYKCCGKPKFVSWFCFKAINWIMLFTKLFLRYQIQPSFPPLSWKLGGLFCSISKGCIQCQCQQVWSYASDWLSFALVGVGWAQGYDPKWCQFEWGPCKYIN